MHEHALSLLSQRLLGVMSNISLVKVSSAEQIELDNFIEASGREGRFRHAVDKKVFLMQPIQDSWMYVSLILIAAAMIVLNPQSTGQDVSRYLVFFYVVRLAIVEFGLFNEFVMSAAQARGAMDRVNDVLDDHGKHVVPQGKQVFTGLKRNLAFRSLNFSYDDGREVLQNASFVVDVGTTTAIVGPSGAGKSTLASMLLRFYDCPPGTIFLDDVDIREYSLTSLYAQMAFVSQDIMLFNESLRYNMTYGLKSEVTSHDLSQAVQRARLDAFVETLPAGLDTVIGERGVRLSGGQRQRLSLARAFLKKAEILVLDEATSSLDSQTEQEIQEAIGEIVKQRTAIVIAHRLSTVMNADKIIVMEHGSVAEQGTLDELLNQQGKFYGCWKLQRF